MTAADTVLTDLDAIRDWQEEIYIDLHQHPELSSHETRTSAMIATRLKAFGYEVHEIGGGVVGVLANGEGTKVLMRADFDALPVTEKTGLPYASTATTVDDDGNTVGLMHACGHDVHVTALLGAARLMIEQKDAWSGTYIALFQPAEETAAGAKAMVEAGLADAIEAPDVAMAQHVMGGITGTVQTLAGPSLSCADSIKVTIHGAGSHGAMPHLGVDPILTASSIVQRLQGIVARELAPGERAVVTVGAINSGFKSNIIPDTATLLLNTRAYSQEVRDHIVEAIERIVRAECAASGCPAEPEFEYYDQFPLTDNDADVTATVTQALTRHLGEARVSTMAPVPASEDFSRVPDVFGVPYTYWSLGGFEPGVEAPGNHSPFFAPVMHPTLSTGTEAAVVAALAYLAPEAASSTEPADTAHTTHAEEATR